MYAETTLLAGTKIFLDPHALGQVLSELGVLFSKAGQGERAIDCLQQAEKICFASDDVAGLASHQCTLAHLMAKHAAAATGPDSQKALEKLRLSLDSCKKHGNNAGVAEATLVHGQIACLQNNSAVGMQKIKLAIDMFRDSQDLRKVAQSLCLLAKSSGVSPMGVVQLQDALEIYRQILDRLGESEALQQLAELQGLLANSSAACKNWLDCLAVKRTIGDIKGAKTCLAALLVEYDKLNDTARLIENASELNEMARQSDDVDKASHALFYLGKTHARNNSPAAGVEALTAAIQLCESAPNSSKAVGRSADCHEYLAQCFMQTGRQAEAMKATQESERLRARLGPAAAAAAAAAPTAPEMAPSNAGANAPPPARAPAATASNGAPAAKPAAAPAPAPSGSSSAKKSSSIFSMFGSKKTNQG